MYLRPMKQRHRQAYYLWVKKQRTQQRPHLSGLVSLSCLRMDANGGRWSGFSFQHAFSRALMFSSQSPSDSAECSYRVLLDDGDVAVADQPPAGVVELRLKAKLLQDENPDAQNCQHTDDWEGHEHSQEGDVCKTQLPSIVRVFAFFEHFLQRHRVKKHRIVQKIQTVVAEEGGIVVHLLHGYLYGRAQPQGTEGQGHIPGSLEADDQPLRPSGGVADDSGSRKCEVKHQPSKFTGISVFLRVHTGGSSPVNWDPTGTPQRTYSSLCTMDSLLEALFSPLPLPAIVSLFALAAATLFYLNNRPSPMRSPVDLNSQSLGIKDGARKTALLEDNNNLVSYYHADATTLYEVFQRGLRVSGNGPCLGFRKPGRPYQWLKYKQVSDRAQHLGSGLLHKGLKPNADTLIGIFAQNRPEACYTYSMVAVPLYDTLGPEALVFIIDRAEISTVLCDNQSKAETLLQNREKGQTPVLKIIVIMDPFDSALAERGTDCGVEVVSLQDVEALGQSNLQQPIVCIVPCTQDVSISFLPLAHMFERVVQTVMYGAGGKVGFFQGDIRLLPDDMKTLQPTVFPVVPRLLNRVYDKVQSGAKTPFKKWLLNFAVQRKFAEVKEGIIRNDSLWDKLIFHKVQESLGGRVRVMVTGAAPISPPVLNFLRASLGCQIFEAYGQTECTAGCTFTMPGDATSGHVGVPMPCNVVKLVDVEEMNYFASNGEGEVWIKGRNVFKGYLKDPKKTAEALDEDGWLHTGDIGKWLPSGVLKIIDRKKNIFKLAQGEYIAPEKIENVYGRSAPVAQVFVHGESLQACLIAIVVPDHEVLLGLAKTLGCQDSFEELCKNTEMKKAILSDMTKLGKEAGLKSFEQVKDVYLHPELFTIENGLLTPTLKAKRAELKALFQPQIDRLYASLQ
ncbi:Long-chain-fatty-acid--CoA ligase 5 [Liparis tanakae]|uniref:Arachidonate--CoA ligase n=1 Tax=Liparis tanakae TaxID=230148 RepID=A0A4Z2J388_9TELE|nr:Long-chain-fatty-acid--CoA ligase 5 [Liparis tanakae]